MVAFLCNCPYRKEHSLMLQTRSSFNPWSTTPPTLTPPTTKTRIHTTVFLVTPLFFRCAQVPLNHWYHFVTKSNESLNERKKKKSFRNMRSGPRSHHLYQLCKPKEKKSIWFSERQPSTASDSGPGVNCAIHRIDMQQLVIYFFFIYIFLFLFYLNITGEFLTLDETKCSTLWKQYFRHGLRASRDKQKHGFILDA